MVLKRSYSLIAPIYDSLVERPTARWREQSLGYLDPDKHQHICIPGIGSGLDIPYLNTAMHYTGVDFNLPMLKKAVLKRALQPELDLNLVNATVYELPFKSNQFDAIVCHLILAVVDKPERALAELVRILKPGGTLLVLDKFLQPGQLAPIRRLLNPIIRQIATRIDVVFETLLAKQPQLQLLQDQKLNPGKWFRHLVLEKTA